MLLAAGRGLFSIDGKTAEPVFSSFNRFATRLHVSKQDSHILYAGLTGNTPGLAVLRYDNGEWIEMGRVPGIDVWGYGY